MQLEPKEILEVLHSREAPEHRAQLVRRLLLWRVIRDLEVFLKPVREVNQVSQAPREIRSLGIQGLRGDEAYRAKWAPSVPSAPGVSGGPARCTEAPPGARAGGRAGRGGAPGGRLDRGHGLGHGARAAGTERAALDRRSSSWPRPRASWKRQSLQRGRGRESARGVRGSSDGRVCAESFKGWLLAG